MLSLRHSRREGSQASEVQLDGVSPSSASGDTWSGFASAELGWLTDAAVAGAEPDRGPAPALGVGLLGAGLATTLAGFAMAELRRKRLLASAAGPPR